MLDVVIGLPKQAAIVILAPPAVIVRTAVFLAAATTTLVLQQLIPMDILLTDTAWAWVVTALPLLAVAPAVQVVIVKDVIVDIITPICLPEVTVAALAQMAELAKAVAVAVAAPDIHILVVAQNMVAAAAVAASAYTVKAQTDLLQPMAKVSAVVVDLAAVEAELANGSPPITKMRSQVMDIQDVAASTAAAAAVQAKYLAIGYFQ